MKKEWILTDNERAVKRKSRADKKYRTNICKYLVQCILFFSRNPYDSCQTTSNGNKRKPNVGVNMDLPSWHQEEEEEVHHQYDDFQQRETEAGKEKQADYFKYDNIR